MTLDDIEYMLWPRLAGLAEIGWSPLENRSWSEFIARLGSHGPRWQLLGIDFFPSGDVPWESLDNLVTQETIAPTSLATPLPTETVTGEGQVSSAENEAAVMTTLQDFVVLIKTHPVEISITLLGFLLLFLAGFWTGNAGRPVNGLRMNIHKFIALGLAAYLIVFMVRIQKGNGWDPLETIAVSVSGILAFTAILTGGLSSLKVQVPVASLIHKITPYLVIISTFITLWIVLT